MERQHRQTPQRKEILRILSESETPVTAEQVHAVAANSFPRLALTTVYRALEALVAQSVAERSIYDDGVARYRVAATHRHFLTCVDCNRAVPLSACPFEQLKDELARETGFAISSHKMEFYGYCPECRKKHEADKTEAAK